MSSRPSGYLSENMVVNPVRMNGYLPSWLEFWAWVLGRWDFCLGCSAVVWSEGCGWHVQVL